MPPLPSPKPLTAKTTDSKRCGHNTNNLHKKVCSNMRPADPGLKDSPFKLKGPEKKNLPQSEDRNKTVKLLTNKNK